MPSLAAIPTRENVPFSLTGRGTLGSGPRCCWYLRPVCGLDEKKSK
jgi:hypothetical protein